MTLSARGEPPFEATGTYAEAKTPRILRFKSVYVFDITQTDGEPLPEPVRVSGDPADHLGRLRDLVRSKGITLDYDSELGGADGVSKGGRICLKPGLTSAEEFAVLVHEYAHERLHRGEDRKQISKPVRELEAEAVAFIVSHAIGLTTGTASSDYIQCHGGDKEALGRSLAKVQKVAEEVIEGLAGEATPDEVTTEAAAA